MRIAELCIEQQFCEILKAARSEGEELEQEWARVEAERDNMSDSGTIISIINIQFIFVFGDQTCRESRIFVSRLERDVVHLG
jgi:hypothetical protein